MFCNKHQISDKYYNIFYLYITKYKNSCFKKKGWAFGRKSSPSFCQDTPDKESRCHWEVIMIVLTDGKDASSAYCLTTALYCPLPGQYLAIARHKTIRRERKNPHSLFYSSPFTKSSETPINTGVPRGEELAQLFTTLHPPFTWIFYFPSGVCLPPGVPADLQSAVKKCSTYETGGFAIPPQSINS